MVGERNKEKVGRILDSGRKVGKKMRGKKGEIIKEMEVGRKGKKRTKEKGGAMKGKRREEGKKEVIQWKIRKDMKILRKEGRKRKGKKEGNQGGGKKNRLQE